MDSIILLVLISLAVLDPFRDMVGVFSEKKKKEIKKSKVSKKKRILAQLQTRFIYQPCLPKLFFVTRLTKRSNQSTIYQYRANYLKYVGQYIQLFVRFKIAR